MALLILHRLYGKRREKCSLRLVVLKPEGTVNLETCLGKTTSVHYLLAVNGTPTQGMRANSRSFQSYDRRVFYD